MSMHTDTRTKLGLGGVVLGLLVQLGAAFFWTPGMFIVAAAIGAPLVFVGSWLTWRGLRALGRQHETSANG